MNPLELLASLNERGVTLQALGDKLRFTPKDALTPDFITALKIHKQALLSLLEPQRSENTECPQHWQDIPLLPPKGQYVPNQDEKGGRRYRAALFNRWYMLRFCPNISDKHIEVVGADGKRRAFADLHEFYRWAWAEDVARNLNFREVN